MIDQLTELAPSIYQGNKARGFWEPGESENRGKKVMLMITELSEAVEAHRIGKYADVENFKNILSKSRIINKDPGYTGEITPESAYVSHFKHNIKNSVEDEIADTVIRILDYCSGLNVPIIERWYRKEMTGDFTTDILVICDLCIKAYDFKEKGNPKGIVDFGYVLAALVKLAEFYKIDLMQHIEWKLRYNATRGYKHGKSY